MTVHVLAGDAGGTKTDLAIVDVDAPGRPAIVREATFASRAYAGLEPMIAEFLAVGPEHPAAAAFGVPGPVLDGEAAPVNLPWRARAASLARACGAIPVRLLNDMEILALGLLGLGPDDVRDLQPGRERPGNRAVLAAGTGLGQGLLVRAGDRWIASATEGGHADFAPPGDREIDLLNCLRRERAAVSWERVVSGPGLHNLFKFLTNAEMRPVAPDVWRRLAAKDDPAAVIGEAAVDGSCPACREAVAWFLRLFAAQAGNVALASLAVGGVYLAGGMIRKLLPRLDADAMAAAFRSRDSFEAVLAEIPLRVVLHSKVSLLGAAAAAADAGK